jgi:hypothetical protein
MLLALKLAIVPALVVALTLTERRWGPRVAGLLAGLPVMSAPTLFFQGDAFAARASIAMLVGLAGIAMFCLAYAWASLRTRWWTSLATGWAAFGAITVALRDVSWTLTSALAVTAASFLLVWTLLPRVHRKGVARALPAWDLPLRALCGMIVVVAVTGLAHRLGPNLSGVLALFPSAIAVLLAFSHAQQGPSSAIGFVRGFLPGMWSSAAFCSVAAITVARAGRSAGLLLAVSSAVLVQSAVWWAARSLFSR